VKLTRLAFDTLPLALTLDAIIMIGVAAHKVNGWQCELLLALSALLGAECLGLSAYLDDLRLHLRDGLHVLVDLLLGLLDDLILLFYALEEVGAEDLELQVLPRLHDLQD
jgi:hypothetical protein